MKKAENTAGLQEVVPKSLAVTRKVNGVYWLAGVGPRPAPIMFIQPCVTEEEAATKERIGWDKYRDIEPRMTNCAQWNLLKNIAMREHIDLEQCYCTAVIKYLPENKAHRNRPTSGMLKQCLPLLEYEIEQVKPAIIVCVGKTVFDLLSDKKLRESDIMGYFDRSDKYNCLLYPIPHISQTLKAEKHERFKWDMKAVKQMWDATKGKRPDVVPCKYRVIRNSAELQTLTDYLEAINATVLSVDCEWGGQIHVDGLLRSLQICWAPGQAAYIRFRDDNANYAFDVDYKEAGRILGQWCNRPEVKYIGHHVSADLTWMAYWLGLDWYDKAIFDTEFAEQCCDEARDLGLDALALRYTPFGKYDVPLIMYRKEREVKEHGRKGTGYEFIPDDILITYALRDVDTCMRAYPIIKADMERQDLVKYYDEVLNPFVTNVFTYWCLKGLPLDRTKLEHTREFYNYIKQEQEHDFLSLVTKEADEYLKQAMEAEGLGEHYDEIYDLVRNGKRGEADIKLKQLAGPRSWTTLTPYWKHFLIAPEFNIRSKPQMQNWLFSVKKYTPVKSTANKAAGMPAVDWEKVLTYPPEKQAEFTPASDKGTLEILAKRHKDATIEALLELNAVGNLCKAFLKPADIDPDTGEPIKENGIAFWVGSDDRIHLNHSTTETGRCRSWSPNVLNWPSYIHARVGACCAKVIKARAAEGRLPEKFKKYENCKPKAYPTIRGLVMAPPGYQITEADLCTAEMRGLAFLSGDEDLLRMILEPDPCWAVVKPEAVPDAIDPADCVVRIGYPDYITERNDDFLMTYASDNVIHARFTEDDLLKDENGKIVSPKFDMH